MLLDRKALIYSTVRYKPACKNLHFVEPWQNMFLYLGDIYLLAILAKKVLIRFLIFIYKGDIPVVVDYQKNK